MLVVLDWMAGTQSLRATVEQLEDIMYIGLDIQEWVFSQAMGGWVQNLRVDLETTSYEEVWQMELLWSKIMPTELVDTLPVRTLRRSSSGRQGQ